MNSVSRRILCCLLITCLPNIVHAATSTATITATVLPLESEEELTISPRSIQLNRETRGKFRVENQASDKHDFELVVRESKETGCRLIVTPRRVTLEPGQAQIFRLFYEAAADTECRTRFSISIRVDDEEKGAVDVDCQ